MKLEITCKYSCDLCGLHRVDVRVPAREDEDVRVWMDQTIHVVSRDHARRSPSCHPTVLTELLIPNPDSADRIGGPSRQ